MWSFCLASPEIQGNPGYAKGPECRGEIEKIQKVGGPIKVWTKKEQKRSVSRFLPEEVLG